MTVTYVRQHVNDIIRVRAFYIGVHFSSAIVSGRRESLFALCTFYYCGPNGETLPMATPGIFTWGL